MADERWLQYLNPKRFRERSTNSKYDGRDSFENDYSRLISSAPIRRLQDKTQVFPLEESDFVRTRLTHSLEVSSIGRSLGKSVEKKLLELKKFPEELRDQISSLLATTGLVHDLGNPPFGHFGEVAIKEFFQEFFGNKNFHGLKDVEVADFTNFDGNVQTFRILRRLYFLYDDNGFNLSFPTLRVVMKYPGSSITGNIKKEHRKHIKDKKFGYFCSEENDYNEINDKLGLGNVRHPVTYLLECADDIAYLAADVEDGVKLKLITFEQILNELKKLSNKTLITSFERDFNSVKDVNIDSLDIATQRLRIKAQTLMIESILEAFVENYENIMDGSFPEELLSHGEAKEIASMFQNLLDPVIKSKKIINVELAGWNVITGLLKEYIPLCLNESFKLNSKSREERYYLTISSSYRYLYENFSKYPNKAYNKIQLIVDFISGMTDNYALQLYQNLTGIRV